MSETCTGSTAATTDKARNKLLTLTNTKSRICFRFTVSVMCRRLGCGRGEATAQLSGEGHTNARSAMKTRVSGHSSSVFLRPGIKAGISRRWAGRSYNNRVKHFCSEHFLNVWSLFSRMQHINREAENLTSQGLERKHLFPHHLLRPRQPLLERNQSKKEI